jgi:monosaccharide-transporting ATPase
VLLARWLCLNPSLLVLDEPTRGIDVGAKAEIQGLIDELADNGLGVLMISSELEEITEGADRVVVLREGRTVAEFDHAEVSQDTVMHAMAHGDEVGSRKSEVGSRPLDGETAGHTVGATPASRASLDEP